jgi:FlaA1/EpsC-like NDP-sugar epimerase
MRSDSLKLALWDGLAMLVSFELALVLGGSSPVEASASQVHIVAALTIGLASFALAGLYRQIWRHAGLLAMQWVLTGGLLYALLFGVYAGIASAVGWAKVSAETVVLTCAFATIGATAVRLSARAASLKTAGRPGARRALIAGAGEVGSLLYDQIASNPALGLAVVGFVDDDPAKKGLRLRGLRVDGPASRIPEIAERLGAQTILIAIPSASGEQLRRIVAACRQSGVPYRTMPGLADIVDDRVTVRMLRQVDTEDLLRRPPLRLDESVIEKRIRGKTVLVTGASGSIGSEAVKQLLRHHPERIVALDIDENGMFELAQRLAEIESPVPVVPMIGDVRDEGKLAQVFSRFRPHFVFHAAAYKHVPLMEMFPEESVRTNVFGTNVAAKLADEHGVEAFIFISTDKAVNPTGVMGCTKRVGELVVQGMAARSKTAFVTVRFGNVLASRGSVLPLFVKQIQAGGPITLTHPDMRRFFMTIGEAVGLVLYAGAVGKSGETYILKMGEPISVEALARDLINFYSPDGLPVEIKYVGVRPGEKMEEELVYDFERPRLSETEYFEIVPPLGLDAETGARVADLLVRAGTLGPDETLAMLSEIVPQYTPVTR